MAAQQKLSDKSVAVLSLIAEGYSYSQIVDGHQDISYKDIFAAAEEALRLNESQSDYHERMAQIKRKYPKAYERWTDDEDRDLTAMFQEGKSVHDMAGRFQRQPGAIRSRLAKLNLESGETDPTDQPS